MKSQSLTQSRLITVNVNGKKYEIRVKSNETLFNVLRNHLKITSVKAACWQGDCGLCTILLEGIPTKSCLVLAYEADNKEITTVEGLSSKESLSTLQESFIQHGAVQCGFCTPAFLLMGHYLLNQGKTLKRSEIEHSLNGIVCRCTGYEQIIDSILAASSKSTT